MHVTVNFWGFFFRTGKIFFGLTRFSCLSVRMTDNFSASFGKSGVIEAWSIVCVSSFVVLMTLYCRSMVVWKTSCHWLIYIQITNRVVIVFTNGFGWNRKCIKGVQWKLCNLKIKLNTDQCLSNKIWGNYYTKHSVLQCWRKRVFFLSDIGSDRNWGSVFKVLPMGFVSQWHDVFHTTIDLQYKVIKTTKLETHTIKDITYTILNNTENWKLNYFNLYKNQRSNQVPNC
jgi:hypothetical protein